MINPLMYFLLFLKASLFSTGGFSNLPSLHQDLIGDGWASKNEQPIAYDITWLPLRFGELVAGSDLSKETIYQVLEQRYAIPVLSGTFTITAAQATAYQATILESEPGAPLLVMQRLSYTTRDEPVYFQERYYRPDRVQYRVSLSRHPNTAGGSKIDRFHAVFEEQALIANP